MTSAVDTRLDDFGRRLRALEAELEQLRREVRADIPSPEPAPPAELDLRGQVLALLAAGNVAAALDELERVRARALEERSVDTLREVQELARHAGAHSKGDDRAQALQLAYAAGQNRVFLGRSRASEAEASVPRLGKSPRPAAPSPSPSPSPSRPAPLRLPSVQLSDLLGARALAIAGGVVTLLGIVFFFVLAVDRGWVGPIGRVGLGAGAAVCVFAAGLVLRRRFGETHSSLAAVGAGIAGAYATLLAAAALYDLLPDAPALAVACGIAAVGVWTSVAWRSQLVAALGLIGALLAPVGVAAQDGVSALGTAFAAFVLAATLVVAVWRRWRLLLVVAVAASAPQVIALALRPEVHGVAPAPVLVLLGLFSLLYVAAGVAHQLRLQTERIDRLTVSLVFGGGLLAAGMSLRLFGPVADRGFALLTIAAVYAVLSLAFFLRRSTRDVSALLAVAGLVVGAFALADLLSGRPLAYAWAAEAAALAWLARRTGEPRFQVWAVAYLSLAFAHVLVFDAPLNRLFVEGGRPAAGAAAVVACAAAAIVVALRTGRWPEPRGRVLRALGRRQGMLRSASLWIAGVAVTYAASLGTLALVASFGWGHVVLAALWAGAGLGILLVALRLESEQLRVGGIAWLGVSATIVIAHGIDALTPIQRSWAYLIVAAALFAAAIAGQLLEKAPSVFGANASVVLAASGVALGAIATAGLLRGELVAYAWASGAAALGWLAWRIGAPHLQALAVGTLGLAVVHVVALDAPPRRLFIENAHPVDGALTVVAATLAAVVLALYARARQRPRPPYGAKLAGLLTALADSRRALRAALLWLAGTAATYALSLGTLALSSSFDWGHVVLTSIWSALALVVLQAGLRLGDAHLRRGGVITLGVVSAIVVGHGFSLASTPRLVSFIALAAALLAGGVSYQLRVPSPAPLEPVAATSVVASLALACSAIVGLLDAEPQGAALLGLGAVYGAVAAALFRRRLQRELTSLLGGIALALAAVAVPLLVQGTYLVLIWASAGAALAYLAAATGERRFLAASGPYILLSAGYALAVQAPPTHLFAADASRGGAVSALIVAAAIVAFARLASEEVAGAVWTGGVIAVYGISLGILELIERTGADDDTTFRSGHTTVSALWGVLALVLLYLGLTRVRALRVAGLALFAISLAKLFLFDLRSLSSITRALSFLAVGAVLLLGGFFYQRLADGSSTSEP